MFDVNHTPRPRAVAFAVALALGLSGCGGGGGGSAQSSPTPPPATGSGAFTGGNVNVNAGNTLLWSDNISGTIDLIKNGGGTLVLTGKNSYTGGTTIDEGTLQLGNGGNTGAITGNVLDNGLLVFNRSDDVTFSGLVNGSGALKQAGSGTLILTGANTYTGGTTVGSGILEIEVGAKLGSGSVTVGVKSDTLHPVLKVNGGAVLPNHIVLSGYGTLDNAGTLGGSLDSVVTGSDVHSATLLNHDGGSIKGTDSAVMISATGTVQNSSAGIIEGGNLGVGLGQGNVSNDGVGSIIRSPEGVAVQIIASGIVDNSGGALIEGRTFGVQLGGGGDVSNDGVGSTIRSLDGMAVQISGGDGVVDNTGGATITGGSTAVYLQYGGNVTNGSGSTIETTGTAGGDCGAAGDCGIFVTPERGLGSSNALNLINAGTIVGSVQLDPNASNTVTLSAGSSIRGDLDIGSRVDSFLTLNGDVETVQLYSHAVTGTTTFAGFLTKSGDGTWIIDSDGFLPGSTTINGGTLQIGNGGITGSIGNSDVTIYHGNLVFDRSDDVTFSGSILGGGNEAYDGTLVQAGTGSLILPLNVGGPSINPSHIRITSGTLQIGDNGDRPTSECACSTILNADVVNDGSLAFNSNWTIFDVSVSGTGSVTQNGTGDVILVASTYTGNTMINNGLIQTISLLPGDVMVGSAGNLDGYSGATLHPGVPGVGGNLFNAGKVFVRDGDSLVGHSYVQASTGTLAVSLGSKLDVTGTATLNGGTLEVTGADSGYVSNTHTNVLTALAGVSGTFAQLVKDAGVVFTATTINYDSNNVWLDTTGLNVTTAAAGNGVHYTAASMGSAQRVQAAFVQLDDKLATGNLSGVSSDFVRAAGQFQQAPTLEAAQASLQSLSGQLHAASAAMTFESIDASSRALSDHFDQLLDKGAANGMWTHDTNVGGDMSRSGFNSVGFQLNGWLVGNDRQIGRTGVAGYAFGQSRSQQRLNQGYDHDNGRSTEGMFYAGWLNGNWYTQGRVGFGSIQQDVSRQILLGESAQGVSSQYNGNYSVAYEETGLHFGLGRSHITPYVDVQYARISRNGFNEQGAGGFGLQSNAQTLDRWQAGVGVRAARRWNFGGDRTIDFNMRAQWQQTLASHGDVFDASFVGMQEWQPLLGVGLSRYSGLFGVGMDATLSKRATLKFSYDYEMGQRDHAQMLSTHLNVAF